MRRVLTVLPDVIQRPKMRCQQFAQHALASRQPVAANCQHVEDGLGHLPAVEQQHSPFAQQLRCGRLVSHHGIDLAAAPGRKLRGRTQFHQRHRLGGQPGPLQHFAQHQTAHGSRFIGDAPAGQVGQAVYRRARQQHIRPGRAVEHQHHRQWHSLGTDLQNLIQGQGCRIDGAGPQGGQGIAGAGLHAQADGRRQPAEIARQAQRLVADPGVRADAQRLSRVTGSQAQRQAEQGKGAREQGEYSHRGLCS